MGGDRIGGRSRGTGHLTHRRRRLFPEVEHALSGDSLLTQEGIEAVEQSLESSGDRVGRVQRRALDHALSLGLVQQLLSASVDRESEVGLQVGELLELRLEGGEDFFGRQTREPQLVEGRGQGGGEVAEVGLGGQAQITEALHGLPDSLDAFNDRGHVFASQLAGEGADLVEGCGRLDSQLHEDGAEFLDLAPGVFDDLGDGNTSGQGFGEDRSDGTGGELGLGADAQDGGLQLRAQHARLNAGCDGRAQCHPASLGGLLSLLERLSKIQILGQLFNAFLQRAQDRVDPADDLGGLSHHEVGHRLDFDAQRPGLVDDVADADDTSHAHVVQALHQEREGLTQQLRCVLGVGEAGAHLTQGGVEHLKDLIHPLGAGAEVIHLRDQQRERLTQVAECFSASEHPGIQSHQIVSGSGDEGREGLVTLDALLSDDLREGFGDGGEPVADFLRSISDCLRQRVGNLHAQIHTDGLAHLLELGLGEHVFDDAHQLARQLSNDFPQGAEGRADGRADLGNDLAQAFSEVARQDVADTGTDELLDVLRVGQPR